MAVNPRVRHRQPNTATAWPPVPRPGVRCVCRWLPLKLEVQLGNQLGQPPTTGRPERRAVARSRSLQPAHPFTATGIDGYAIWLGRSQRMSTRPATPVQAAQAEACPKTMVEYSTRL